MKDRPELLINQMEDEIDELLRDEALEQAKELLEGEKIQRREDGWKYRYGCPHCNFQADYFHEVEIHVLTTKKCRDEEKHHPCYPILLHQPKGAPIP
jgi:hypothetical protein